MNGLLLLGYFFLLLWNVGLSVRVDNLELRVKALRRGRVRDHKAMAEAACDQVHAGGAR